MASFLADFMLCPNRRRKLWWVLALALGVAVVVPAGWYGYRSLKDRRARDLIAEAEKLAIAQQWNQAHQRILAALQIAPEHPQGLRLAARLLSRFGREEAFSYWQRAFASAPGTIPEVLEVLDFAVAIRRFDIADRSLAAALRQHPRTPELMRAGALVCAAKGDVSGAIQFAQATLQTRPGDWEMGFVLAQQLLKTGHPEAQQQARTLLWEVASGDHNLAARALVILASSKDLSSTEIERCLERLERYPAQDIVRDLLVQQLKIRQEPGQRAPLIDAVVQQYGTGTPTQLLMLARWLNDQNEPKKVTQLVPVAVALTNKELFLVYGDALATQGAWDKLSSILAQDNLPIEASLVDLYRARTAKELKQDRQAAVHWAQAQYKAANNPSALQYLAEYAERLGETAEAMKAHRQLTRHPATARAAYLALIRLAEQTGDTRQLRALMKELAGRFPDDPAPRIDLAYLDLLAGENLAAAREVAQELYQKNPTMLAYRTTLALAYLRQNDPASALSLYRDVQTDWAAMLPGWQAVRTAVLGASGEKAAASELARSISQDRLKPEERALIQPWL